MDLEIMVIKREKFTIGPELLSNIVPAMGKIFSLMWK